MLTYKIKDVYDEQLMKKNVVRPSVLVEHQQRSQRLGLEKRRSRQRKNRRMSEIISMARKNLAEGKVVKVGQ